MNHLFEAGARTAAPPPGPGSCVHLGEAVSVDPTVYRRVKAIAERCAAHRSYLTDLTVPELDALDELMKE